MCVFKFKNKKKIIFSGRGISDEMCLGFMVVFFVENFFFCMCIIWRSFFLIKFYWDLNFYGCNIMNFFNFFYLDIWFFLEKFENNCKLFFICLEECKEVVKEVWKYFCLSGDVGKYIVYRVIKMFNGDFFRFLFLF